MRRKARRTLHFFPFTPSHQAASVVLIGSVLCNFLMTPSPDSRDSLSLKFTPKPHPCLVSRFGREPASIPSVLSNLVALAAKCREAPEHGGDMLRHYGLPLMGLMLASFSLAQDRHEHLWENVESLRVGQKLEVTTAQLRTIQGSYLNSSGAAIRLKTPGEVPRREPKTEHTRRSRRWSPIGRRTWGRCRLQGRCGRIGSWQQQRQTGRHCGWSRPWCRHRIIVRWASRHLPREGSATTLVPV